LYRYIFGEKPQHLPQHNLSIITIIYLRTLDEKPRYIIKNTSAKLKGEMGTTQLGDIVEAVAEDSTGGQGLVHLNIVGWHASLLGPRRPFRDSTVRLYKNETTHSAARIK